MGVLGNEQNWGAWCEIPKNQIWKLCFKKLRKFFQSMA